MSVERLLNEAKKLAEKEGMELKDVLYLYEIESRRMTFAVIERMHEELQSIRILLDQVKAFEASPTPKMI